MVVDSFNYIRSCLIMNFASDNWAGVHPAISKNLLDISSGFCTPYGASDFDKNVEQRFNELFEREVAVYFVSTGTAANSLALAYKNFRTYIFFLLPMKLMFQLKQHNHQ